MPATLVASSVALYIDRCVSLANTGHFSLCTSMILPSVSTVDRFGLLRELSGGVANPSMAPKVEAAADAVAVSPYPPSSAATHLPPAN